MAHGLAQYLIQRLDLVGLGHVAVGDSTEDAEQGFAQLDRALESAARFPWMLLGQPFQLVEALGRHAPRLSTEAQQIAITPEVLRGRAWPIAERIRKVQAKGSPGQLEFVLGLA